MEVSGKTTIEEGASLKIGTLGATHGGHHSASGTFIANEMINNGLFGNDEDANDQIKADITINNFQNNGTVDFKDEVRGTIDQATLSGGMFYQNEKNNFWIGSLTLSDNSELKNQSNLTIGTEKDKQAAGYDGALLIGTELNLDGGKIAKTDTLTQTAGQVNIKSDRYTFDQINQSGGNIHVKENATLEIIQHASLKGVVENTGTIEGNASAEVSGSGRFVNAGSLALSSLTVKDMGTAQFEKGASVTRPLSTNLAVHDYGNLIIGDRTSGTQWAESLGALSHGKGRLIVTSHVKTGTGGITVGAADASQGTGGNLWFGNGSTTVIDAPMLADGSSAFKAGSDSATITVENGASLTLGGIASAGKYIIASGYDTAPSLENGTWRGGWTGNSLQQTELANSGLKWNLSLHNDADTVWVSAVLQDVRDVYPGISLPENINNALSDCGRNTGAGGKFLCDVLTDGNLSKAEKAGIINAAASTAFASGALLTAINDQNLAAQSLEERLSMRGESFNKDGELRIWDRGHKLWADILGGKQKTKGLRATGTGHTDFDDDTYGLIAGYDHLFANRHFTAGGALSYTKGTLHAGEAPFRATNKHDSTGIHAYAGWSPSEKLNLTGSVSYLIGNSDASRHLGSAGRTTADIRTSLFSAALRAESTIKAGYASVIPHIGVRFLHSKTRDYDLRINNAKAFRSSADSTDILQVPAGLALRGDFSTASGWTFRTSADISVVPQAGNVRQRTSLKGADDITDTVSGEFAGHIGSIVSMAIQADKDNSTLGLRYGYTAGEHGSSGHAMMLEMRHGF